MLPPGPRTPRLWQTFEVLLRPTAYLTRLRGAYGDVMSFDNLAGVGVVVVEAGLAREVFASSGEVFETLPMVGSVFGPHAVIATSGPEHRRQRKLLNPSFHGARIRALYETMREVIARHLLALRPGTVVKMTDVAQELTLDVILETIFGASLDDATRDRGRELLRDIVHAFHPILIVTTRLHSPFVPSWRKYERARAELRGWVDEVIRQRTDEQEDLLGLLLAARYDDGAPLDRDELHDHLLTLLLAGHETSAIAITWATHWLLREPRVIAEVKAATRGLSTEQIVKSPYVGAVVSETLRIAPIVTDVVRKCREPYQLREWTIPKGGLVAVMLSAILSDERTFPEPGRYRPERFLERTYHAGELLPFGGGQRRCLGAAFAEAEMALTIATIANHLDLELVDRTERTVRRNITMGPAKGVRVRVRAIA